MKDLFGNLWTQFTAAGAPARWALATVLTALFAVGGYSVYAAKNPSYEVLLANLEEARFSSAAGAIASAGIRYRATNPPGPYTIFVERGRAAEALAAVHQAPDYAGPSRGISGEVGGTASVFLGQSERDQRAEKRRWEEAELSLERLVWVSKARVTVSTPGGGALLSLRTEARHAAAVVSLAGTFSPDAEQRRTLGGIVANTTGVPRQNVQVTDQHGNLLYDGTSATDGSDFLSFERSWQESLERRLQSKLDRAFGPGMTIVGVSGTWRHTRQESVEEALQPASKPVSKRSRKVEDPEMRSVVGGPAGAAANLQETRPGALENVPAAIATTDEKEESYAFGSKTTHTISEPHTLEQMMVTLLIDESREEQLAAAEDAVKNWSAFVEDRDVFRGTALALAGLERGEDGAPIVPEAEALPEPADPRQELLLEHAIEIFAALAFLFVLLRSLKSARAAAVRSAELRAAAASGGSMQVRIDEHGQTVITEGGADEEVDLDLLARRHVEELLENEPEKVSALLSRWALGEQAYAGAGASSEREG